MVDMIRSSGYEPEVWYPNQTQDVNVLVRLGVFGITRDSLLGEIINFDLDKYNGFIEQLKSTDVGYRRTAQKYETFGEDGLRRAIQLVASQHKWKKSATEAYGDGDEEGKPPSSSGRASLAGRNYPVTESERQSVVLGVRELQKIIDTADISQQDKSQAQALAHAALILSEAPSPNWRLIRELLYSVAAIATIFGIAIQLAELIH